MMLNFDNSAPKLAMVMLIMVLTCCKIDHCDAPAPELKFEEFIYTPADPNDVKTTDTLILKTSFLDCQGDIGLKKEETGHNLRTYLYEWLDGNWVRFYPDNLDDTLTLFAAIPYSYKVKEGVKVEGFLEQKFGSIRQNSDTIRFRTFLFDREGNKSNEVVTPEFIFPQ